MAGAAAAWSSGIEFPGAWRVNEAWRALVHLRETGTRQNPPNQLMYRRTAEIQLAHRRGHGLGGANVTETSAMPGNGECAPPDTIDYNDNVDLNFSQSPWSKKMSPWQSQSAAKSCQSSLSEHSWATKTLRKKKTPPRRGWLAARGIRGGGAAGRPSRPGRARTADRSMARARRRRPASHWRSIDDHRRWGGWRPRTRRWRRRSC